MEDKYFNEFFDKLYNGKLNIYEDEEEENSEVGYELDSDVEGERVNDFDNEQNSKISNKEYKDKLKKLFILNNGKNYYPTFEKYIKFLYEIKDIFKELPIGKKTKIKMGSSFTLTTPMFKTGFLYPLFEIYDIPFGGSINIGWIDNFRGDEKEENKNFIKKYIRDELNINNFKEKLVTFKEQLKPDKTTPTYHPSTIKNNLKKYVKIFGKTKNIYLDDTKLKDSVSHSRATLKWFFYFYGFINDSNKNVLTLSKPIMHKWINILINDDYYKGKKDEYIKFINNIDSNFKEKLEILKNQFIVGKDVIKDVETIYSVNNIYKDLGEGERKKKLNGFWELYGDIPHNKGNYHEKGFWRNKIRDDKEYKKEVINYIDNTYGDFYEKLIEFREQFEERDPEWKRYQKSFSKEYNGNQYFEQKKWAKHGSETGEFESKIHNLSNDNINIVKTINEYVYKCYITSGTTTQKVKKERICPYNYDPSQIPEFYNWLKDKVVDIVKAHLIEYLKKENTKIKKYDIFCSQSLGDVIKSGDKLEIKKMRELDGRFASYINSGFKPKNIPSKIGKAIYKEFILMLVGKNEELKEDSIEIFNKIINDNCEHFDGMLIGDDGDEYIEGFTLYVPKEYITLYISTTKWRRTAFTLRYHINVGDLKNCYRIIKPKNSGGDLTIRLLNDDDIKFVTSWGMGMVDKIYEKGKCPPGQSVNESYDSYLDQLVENFFNTGKLFP